MGAGRVGGGDVDDFGGRLLLDAGDVRVLHDADADARLVGRHVGRLDGETHLTVGRPNDDVLVDSSFGFSSCFFFLQRKRRIKSKHFGLQVGIASSQRWT